MIFWEEKSKMIFIGQTLLFFLRRDGISKKLVFIITRILSEVNIYTIIRKA